MGRANSNRKMPRHRIISYNGEALVNDRVASKSRVNNTQIFEKVYLTLFKVFDS